MVTRIGKILAVAAVYRYDALVLGAYGCGVFQNNPTDVAGYFARFLGPGGRFENVFRHVTFAVPEKGRSKHNHHVFKRGSFFLAHPPDGKAQASWGAMWVSNSPSPLIS